MVLRLQYHETLQLNNISRIFTAKKPDYVQFAINGNYENAWKIDFDQGRPYKKEINKFLDSEQKVLVISFEAHYKTKDDIAYYFGVRYPSNFSKVNGFADFFDKTSKGIWKSNKNDITNVISNISFNLTGKEDEFMKPNALDRIVVVLVVNWWKTYGEIKIWGKGQQRLITEGILKEKMTDKLPLLSDKNYAGMEIVFEPNTNWFCIQVSDKKGKKFVFNPKKAVYFMEKICNFNKE